MTSPTDRSRLSAVHVVIAVVLVLLSCVGALAAVFAVPAKYSTTSKLVLIGPNVSATGQASNPFVDFSGGLNTTADVLALSSMTAQNADSVVAAGGTRSYQTVSSGASSSEPIITITSQAPTKTQAIWTAKLLTVRLQADLAARQTAASVPANLRVTMASVTTPERASRQLKTTVEIAIAVLVGSLLISVGIVLLLDRRRRRLLAAQLTSVPVRDARVIADDAVANGKDVAVVNDSIIEGSVVDGPIVKGDAPFNGAGGESPVTDRSSADTAADTQSSRRRVRVREQESATRPATNDSAIEAKGSAIESGGSAEVDGSTREAPAGDGLPKCVAEEVRSYLPSSESANGAQSNSDADGR